MTKRQKIAWALVLTLLLALLSPITSSAEDIAAPPSVDDANAVYFYHVESESVVVEKNAQLVVSAGSTVKVMSGLIFCEVLADYATYEVQITESMTAGLDGFFRLKLEAGDTLTVEQLLYAALCGGYNDAYQALAVYVAGSLDAFVLRMNAKAQELGMAGTVYTDVHGLDDASLTTAADLARLASAASQNEQFMKITSTARYALAETHSLRAQTIHNRNALISSNSTTQYHNGKCRGMNAGYTARSGNCVMTLADNGRERYLCIVMGAVDEDNANHGYLAVNRLVDWVYKTYTYMEVISSDTVICTVPVTVSDLTSEVEVKTRESLSCYLPAGLELGRDVTYSIRLTHTTLEAPVREGEQVGYVAVLWNGRTLGTVPLYTAGSAERSSFISSLLSMQALTQNRVFVAGFLFFAVVLTAWITAECIIKQRRRKKWDKYFSMKMSPTPDLFEKKQKKN